MKWELRVTQPSRTGIPEIDKKIFKHHLLLVNREDDLSLVFLAFWRKLLAYALTSDSPDWEIVVINFRLSDGMFEGSLVSQDWVNDQPHRYMISLNQVLEEIESLERDDDDLEDRNC